MFAGFRKGGGGKQSIFIGNSMRVCCDKGKAEGNRGTGKKEKVMHFGVEENLYQKLLAVHKTRLWIDTMTFMYYKNKAKNFRNIICVGKKVYILSPHTLAYV